MAKQHIKYGGRGSGRPQDWFMYGKRKCQIVRSFNNMRDAYKLADKFEREGILTVVRKWYSQWVVYRCGARLRSR